MDYLLWGVLPYVSALLLIGGLIWRYTYDQFGWTTRSSQLYESTILRVASPLFHYALFAVLAGHLVGLFIPKHWTDSVGISQELYHWNALVVGGIAGAATLIGIALLIWRRRKTGPVFMATTANDKVMYVFLAGAILLGLWATFTGDHTATGEHHNYRETVSVWLRSLFVFRPDIEAMAAATIQFKVHVVVALLLFAMLPFTRLVHAFTVPLHYLFRPYVVYRRRTERPLVSSGSKRGWDPLGTPDRQQGRRS